VGVSNGTNRLAPVAILIASHDELLHHHWVRPSVMDELIPTRATLIKRLKNWEDQSSWQDFFDIYWQLIYRVARKAGLSEVEAQDVVQETMFSVAKHMPRFQYNPAIGSFKAWLLNLTRWRIRDQLRKRVSYLEYPEPSNDSDTGTRVMDRIVDPASLNLDAVWEAEWENNLLRAAMARVKRQVDPRKFQIFDLYVNKQWPAARVAKAFAVTVDQVYLAKHRLTDLLKQEVERIKKQMR
jgi:RNA polymerase sigma factor (sigma-70 family)